MCSGPLNTPTLSRLPSPKLFGGVNESSIYYDWMGGWSI